MLFKRTIKWIFLIIMSLGLIGCRFVKPINPSKALEEYPIPKNSLDKIINEHVEPISVKPSFGGKPFCNYTIIGSDKNNNTIKIYLILLAQEYYIKDDKLVEGTGGEFDGILTIKQENNNYKFIDCNISQQIQTEESIKIFPKHIRKKALKIHMESSSSDSSIKKIEKKAETYFKKTVVKTYM
ncbi:hypothetical protein [Clostridium sp. Marseille-Q2269]|uniref:hypothetical protein n=1 Tax=Clostridium sp. Marseille-Q2269 TaxID=2942205 RepID=UPI002073A8EF|nr:hypothetical protein [Clostridium sp. Marseille-Q2269]